MNDLPLTSTCANTRRLPKCLEALGKDDIMRMFLDMKDSQGNSIWINKDCVEQGFFAKLEEGFDFFLNSTVVIENYPLEALLWAYLKDEQTFRTDAEVIGWLYNDSRGGQIIPRSPANSGNIQAVDTILDTYFSTLKNLKALGNNKFERLVTNQIITLTLASYHKKDYALIDFLLKFYLDHSGVIYISSFIIQAICCATYGLNEILTSSIHSFEESQNAEVISFVSKGRGVQFGTIVHSQDKNQHVNTLFVKAHQNYPYKGPYRYIHSSQSPNLSFINTLENSLFLPPRSVDLKELFAYKVLEYTGFGPKTHFILNDDFEGFLYIGTEEIEKLVTLGDFKIKYPELFKTFKTQFQDLGSQIMKDDFQIIDEYPNNIILELIIFDLVARSMLFCDLNEGNIGFVLNHPEKTAIKAVDFMIALASKIWDKNIEHLRWSRGEKRGQLLQSMQKNPYVYNGVVNSFLDTNAITKYPPLLTIPFQLDFSDPNFFEYGETIRKNKKELGALAVKRLGRLDLVFTKAYEDICAFVKGKERLLALHRGVIPDHNIGEVQTKDPMTDLEQYKEAVIIHFQLLSEFLTQSNCKKEYDDC